MCHSAAFAGGCTMDGLFSMGIWESQIISTQRPENSHYRLKASGKWTKCPWAWANFCSGSQRSQMLREIDVALEIAFLLLRWNISVQYKNKYFAFSWDYQFVGPPKGNVQDWSLRLTDSCLQRRILGVWADWHSWDADWVPDHGPCLWASSQHGPWLPHKKSWIH